MEAVYDFSKFFDGFVRVNDNKEPLHPWKDPVHRLSWENTINYSGNVCGVLKNESYYVVDIDEPKAAELVLQIIKDKKVNCVVVKTTRGMHFYFASGSPYDVKIPTGKGRKTNLIPVIEVGYLRDENGDLEGKVDYLGGLVCIKWHGKFREILYQTETIDICPAWLQPFTEKKKDVGRFFVGLLGLKEGSRNDTMTSYGGHIRNKGFTADEWYETACIVNDYILADPFDDRELESITDAEKFESWSVQKRRPGRQKNPENHPKNEVSADGKIEFPTIEGTKKHAYGVVAQELIEEFHIKRIEDVSITADDIYVYDNGVYTSPETVNGNVLFRYLENKYYGVTIQICKEVLGAIGRLLDGREKQSESKYISLKNGIFDLEEMVLLPHDPKYVIANQLNVEYNPNAYSKLLDTFLDDISCNDPDIRALLEEFAGYCLDRDLNFRKAFMLVGHPHNGKSTFLKTVTAMLGEQNVCDVDPIMTDPTINKFRLPNLRGMLANICNDIEDTYIKSTSNFKSIISCDRITAENKGKDSFSFTPRAKHAFSMNEAPRVKDAGGAVTDRFLFVPIDIKIEKPDPTFEHRLKEKEPLEYLLLLAINAHKRIAEKVKVNDKYEFRGFTVSEKSLKMLEQYRAENDTVKAWLDSLDDTPENFLLTRTISTTDAYGIYSKYCIDQNYYKGKVEPAQFTKRVKRYANVDSKKARVNGELVYKFVES